jgi:predicted nucleic acid-binding protein
MMISIDTNVIAALWSPSDSLNAVALAALRDARRRASLAISAPVYAELLAGPLRTGAALDQFLHETGIAVDWQLEEAVWRSAGKAFRAYAARRRKNSKEHPRRILADFLIGAQALSRGYALLTLDHRQYEVSFPQLSVIRL